MGGVIAVFNCSLLGEGEGKGHWRHDYFVAMRRLDEAGMERHYFGMLVCFAQNAIGISFHSRWHSGEGDGVSFKAFMPTQDILVHMGVPILCFILFRDNVVIY